MPKNTDRNPNRDRNQNQDRTNNHNQNDMREEFGTAFDIDKLNEQHNNPQTQTEKRTNRFENNNK